MARGAGTSWACLSTVFTEVKAAGHSGQNLATHPSMQPHNGARCPGAGAGGATLTAGKQTAGGSRAWTIAAYSGSGAIYNENDAMLLNAAKWEHQGTTAAARRALRVRAGLAQVTEMCCYCTTECNLQNGDSSLRVSHSAGYPTEAQPTAVLFITQVVAETQGVAQHTLEQLYQQGQQVQQAAHGVHQIDDNVKHAGRIVRFMGRMCCMRTAARDPDLERETVSRSEEVQR